jgi:hypothetical protein
MKRFLRKILPAMMLVAFSSAAALAGNIEMGVTAAPPPPPISPLTQVLLDLVTALLSAF